MHIRRALPFLAASILAVLSACTADVPTIAPPQDGPAQEIYDWPEGGTRGFTFLPRTVPPGGNPFDANVQPTVRLCRITNTTTNACTTTLASWTRTSGSYSRTVTVGSSSYSLSWPTGSTGATSGQTYRVTVLAAGRTLGWQDVRIVSTTAQFNAVNTAQYKPCYTSANCVISFRIETGIPGSISVSSASVNVGVGNGVTVTGRKSPNSLYKERVVTFEDDAGAYNQLDAEGFIKLQALRLRLRQMD